MDIEKLIERFEYDAKDWAGDPHIKRDLLEAATALSTLQAENEKLRAELEQVKQEVDAAQSLLAERIGVRGAEPITTAFGLPLDRLRELAQADREGRCVVLDDRPHPPENGWRDWMLGRFNRMEDCNG